ncbi:AraC family transcriptional regulator [Spartinivicinus poritis]|uniref:AraC family transcriptional regulator n=1 Tax=Spartinivicinus poritis TaxID=2994640 RepID=A0ABT5UEU6_9GAMM|nr:AraC family transcriptional regulator [Spartinivicinus sp. A2-2]MDE1464904.1 AraC family transcriptional regulator [Spartinivicinus sp. A2-2]
MTSTIGSTSTAALSQFIKLAEHYGLPVEPLAKQAGINPSQLSSSSSRVSLSAMEKLLHQFIQLSNDPLFGLHAAQFVQPGSYHVLGYIAMNCATLAEAVDRIQRYEALVGDMGRSQLKPSEKGLVLSWQCQFTDSLVHQHMVDHCLASWVNYGRWITDRNENPQKIELTRAAPNLSAQVEYQQIFQCSIVFQAPQNAVWISREHLQVPLRQADPGLLQTLEQHANQLISQLNNQDISQQVSATIQQMMPNIPKPAEVAAQLGISARTLQRRLQQKNTHYQALLDEVRLVTAKQILINTQSTIEQTAHAVGFHDVRSFRRRFKQWTGLSPSEYRVTPDLGE